MKTESTMKGFAIGVLISTILWVLCIEYINKIHRQELDYVIEKTLK